MSYYDFDYFWTHEEIGGKKLKVSPQPSKLDLIKKNWRIISNNPNYLSDQIEKYPESLNENNQH